MNAQCPMTNVITGRPRKSVAQEPQRHCPVGRPRPANSATVPRHWPLAIGHSLVIGYWPLVVGRQGGSIEFVNGRAPGGGATNKNIEHAALLDYPTRRVTSNNSVPDYEQTNRQPCWPSFSRSFRQRVDRCRIGLR